MCCNSVRLLGCGGMGWGWKGAIWHFQITWKNWPMTYSSHFPPFYFFSIPKLGNYWPSRRQQCISGSNPEKHGTLVQTYHQPDVFALRVKVQRFVIGWVFFLRPTKRGARIFWDHLTRTNMSVCQGLHIFQMLHVPYAKVKGRAAGTE